MYFPDFETAKKVFKAFLEKYRDYNYVEFPFELNNCDVVSNDTISKKFEELSLRLDLHEKVIEELREQIVTISKQNHLHNAKFFLPPEHEIGQKEVRCLYYFLFAIIYF